MADISKYTGRFRINTGSGDQTARKIAKKPREALACTQCRTSKLRCDKGRPCSSCVRRDGGSSCSYTRTAVEEGGRTAAEDRLDKLESMVSQLLQNQAAASAALAPQPDTPPDVTIDEAGVAHEVPTEGLKYPTVLEDIMNNINELKLAIPAMSDELEKVPRAEEEMRGSERIFASASNYSLEQILAQYLPERREADDMLFEYSQGDAFIQPFLHAQQFRKQYEEFWDNQLDVNPMWLSLLFSIFTMSAIAREARILAPETPNSMSPKSLYHAAAGECLAVGRYYRPQPFGPHALILYAHCVNLKNLDPSREAGAMLSMGVRLAYEMGYHRDPEVFGTFNVFEAEMRRRFWAACKQIDMMTSFQLGLPSTILLDNCDTKSPRNLFDSDFGPESTELPLSRSENENTGILWFIVKDRLVPSFNRVCQDALSLRRKSEEEVRALDEEIRRAHHTIPPLLRVQSMADSVNDSGFMIMARFYIELLHLKSLCILHRKHMASGSLYSTNQCIEAGLSIVKLVVGVYKEFGPGGQLYQVRFMFNSYYMSDFLLGVIMLCLYVNICKQNGRVQEGMPGIGASSDVFAVLERAHEICVDKSSASRDARKVSLAIRLALQGTERATVGQAFGRHAPREITMENFLQPAATEDPATSWFDAMATDYTATAQDMSFDALDPFNFMTTEPYDYGTMFASTDPTSWTQNNFPSGSSGG